jgi:hypothetical protein
MPNHGLAQQRTALRLRVDCSRCLCTCSPSWGAFRRFLHHALKQRTCARSVLTLRAYRQACWGNQGTAMAFPHKVLSKAYVLCLWMHVHVCALGMWCSDFASTLCAGGLLTYLSAASSWLPNQTALHPATWARSRAPPTTCYNRFVKMTSCGAVAALLAGAVGLLRPSCRTVLHMKLHVTMHCQGAAGIIADCERGLGGLWVGLGGDWGVGRVW